MQSRFSFSVPDWTEFSRTFFDSPWPLLSDDDEGCEFFDRAGFDGARALTSVAGGSFECSKLWSTLICTVMAWDVSLVIATSSSSSNFLTLLATISDAATVEERIDMESSWYFSLSQGLAKKSLLAFIILRKNGASWITSATRESWNATERNSIKADSYQ